MPNKTVRTTPSAQQELFTLLLSLKLVTHLHEHAITPDGIRLICKIVDCTAVEVNLEPTFAICVTKGF